ncbi:Spore wall protein 7 [Dictyocoela muelleri]|nr:Spore wall protein 7 [Dictyocoela muelleri]
MFSSCAFIFFSAAPYFAYGMTQACSSDNKIFNLDLKIHTNQYTINAIRSISLESDMQLTDKEAVAEYYGGIIDELNEYLARFNIKIHLNLDAYNSDEFIPDSIVEPSCEKGNPIETRTSIGYEYLKKKFNDNIGLHLFVWSCIYVQPAAEMQIYYANLRCGRIMGLIWDGWSNTKENVKAVVINAISGMEHTLIKTGSEDQDVRGKICKYVQECLGMDANQVGVIEFLSE